MLQRKNGYLDSYETLDDLEIISQVRLGRVAAYEIIVRKYQTTIRSFCTNMLNDQALGEDAAQETFIRAFRNLKGFKPRATFSAWLFRIARNYCIDLLRKQSKVSACSLEQLQAKHGDNLAMFFKDHGQTSDVSETRDLIRKILASLSTEYREIIVLREVYGLSYDELAEVLEVTLDGVKARLKRARAKLMQNMGRVLDSTNVKERESIL